MAWNEPGGGDGRDPWGGGDQQGPPDLDEALKKLQEKLGGMFGKGGKGKGNGMGSGGKGGPIASISAGLVITIVLVGWVLSGIYIVDQAEEAVITRFGKYVRTEPPGPHWMPNVIENAERLNVQQVRTAEIGFRTSGRSSSSVSNEALMLTEDENIIDIKFAVQYKIKDARDYLFKLRDPDTTLRQATESAVREIVGKNSMDFVLTGGREEVADVAEGLIQKILDRYEAGLLVTSVNMQDAQPPTQVQAAFADAVKAREDEERFKNEAEAFANDILPKARGDADAKREQAEAYKQRVIALAEGEANRFVNVLKEYQKAPQVTRERLYLDAVESVLGNSSKILMDAKGGNSLMYLPIDKLISRGNNFSGESNEALPQPPQSNSRGDTMRRQSDNLRRRSR